MEKVIKVYFHKHDAQMAQGLLQEKGIESIVSADDAGGFRHHLTLSMGNVRLLVRESDAERALEALKVLEESVDESVLQVEFEKTLLPANNIAVKPDGIKLIARSAAVLFIAIYSFLLAGDSQVDMGVYDEDYKEPFNIYCLLSTWPLDILMILLGIGLYQFYEPARRVVISLLVIVFCIHLSTAFIPAEWIWTDTALESTDIGSWFGFGFFGILYAVPLIVYTRPEIKQLFRSKVEC